MIVCHCHFENSIFIELAITALEQNGISNEKILAAPLDKRAEQRKLFDTIHRADGLSLFDASAMLGTCLMLLGAIYGYVLKWVSGYLGDYWGSQRVTSWIFDKIVDC